MSNFKIKGKVKSPSSPQTPMVEYVPPAPNIAGCVWFLVGHIQDLHNDT